MRVLRLVVLAFVTALLLGLVTADQLVPSAAAKRMATPMPPSSDCTDYPEPRVMLEEQVWWRDAGLQIPSQVGEHIHISACWPRYGTIIGNSLHVDLRVLVHAGDEATHHFLDRMRINWRTTSEDVGGPLLDSTDPARWAIPLDANGDGQRVFGFDLNLSALGTGPRRIRFNPMAGSDPDRMFASGDWWLCKGSCGSLAPKGNGKGWYSPPHEYQNAASTTLPGLVVSGIHCITANMNPGGGGEPTIEHVASIDPRYHHGDIGLLVKRGPGSFSGHLCVDTTRLTNGPHRWVLIASDGKVAGVHTIPFEVAN